MGSAKSIKYQNGAALPEYILLLAILIPIFALIGIVLQKTAISSGQRSAKSVSNVVPCGNNSALGVNGGNTDECL